MDNNLFSKYSALLVQKRKEKHSIIEYIKEKTGIDVIENEITIKGTSVVITTSSTKRSLLKINNIEKILQDKGYTIGNK